MSEDQQRQAMALLAEKMKADMSDASCQTTQDAFKPIVVEKVVEKIKHVHIDDESDKVDDAQIPTDERGFYKIFKHL